MRLNEPGSLVIWSWVAVMPANTGRPHRLTFSAQCWLLAARITFKEPLYQRPVCGVLHDPVQIRPHEDFAAADVQKERARCRQLIQQAQDFGGRHLAVIVVIEIAVDAALVAAVGQIQLHAQRIPSESARAPMSPITLMSGVPV